MHTVGPMVGGGPMMSHKLEGFIWLYQNCSSQKRIPSLFIKAKSIRVSFNIQFYRTLCNKYNRVRQKPPKRAAVTQNKSLKYLFSTYFVSMSEFCSSHYFLETLIIFTCVRIQVHIQCSLCLLYIYKNNNNRHHY